VLVLRKLLSQETPPLISRLWLVTRNKSLIQNAVKKSNLTYEQTLVLADEDAVLAAARDVGCVTCRLNAPNRRRGRVTTDLAAQGMDGLKGLIEEYNGVSFR